jgi:hypothetical protein
MASKLFSPINLTSPSMEVINHLADGGRSAISESAILRALAFADYLEAHAKRAYGAASEVETTAAKAILKHIRNGDIPDGFTSRDVHQPRWSIFQTTAMFS